MKTSEIIDMLCYPDAAIVALAVERANLTAQEWEAVKLRVYENKTIEQAAEVLDISVSTLKRRCSTAFWKLNACWSGTVWVKALVAK